MIPECEPSHSNVFKPDWINHAIPHKNGHLDPCNRYKFIANSTITANSTCNAHNFNQTRIIPCRSFIIKNHGEHIPERVRIFCGFQCVLDVVLPRFREEL